MIKWYVPVMKQIMIKRVEIEQVHYRLSRLGNRCKGCCVHFDQHFPTIGTGNNIKPRVVDIEKNRR